MEGIMGAKLDANTQYSRLRNMRKAITNSEDLDLIQGTLAQLQVLHRQAGETGHIELISEILDYLYQIEERLSLVIATIEARLQNETIMAQFDSIEAYKKGLKA
jgi:hypothetical protein